MASESPAPWSRVHLWHIQFVRDLLVIGAAIGLVAAGYALRTVTVPLLIALGLAYLLEPVVRAMLRRKGMTRPRAVTWVLVLGLLVVAVPAAIGIPLVVGQTIELVGDVTSGRARQKIERIHAGLPESVRERLRPALSVLPGGPAPAPLAAPGAPSEDADAGAETGATADEDGASGAGDRAAPPPEATVDAPLDRAAIERIVDERLAARGGRDDGRDRSAALLGLARGGLSAVLGVLGAIVNFSVTAFLVPFAFWFFACAYPGVLDFGRRLLPRRNRGRLLELMGKMDRVVAGFVRGRIVISLIMGVLFALGWALCDVPYAIVLGMITGILSLVPYLGGVGLPVALGLLAAEQLALPPEARMAWWAVLLWPTLVFGLVQVLEGYVLTPKIAGDATGLDPVTIFVVVIAGGSIAGVYGMLLAIPAAACGKILLLEVVMPRIRAWVAGESEDPLPIE